MYKLTLFSEPFAPTGNIAAEGFRNLLGRPDLGLLATVIRESIQNSVDAADGGSASILIRVRELSGSQAAILRENVLSVPDTGVVTASLGRLQSALVRRPLRVLEICDFGTSGLGGPTRADLVSDEEDSDFVNFMRNVGAPRDTHHGGGTYGYGKTSLYAMSSCATILVDSLTSYRRQPVRRLMGAHLGEAFSGSTGGAAGRRRYTGRHWWGIPDADEAIDPVEGPSAAAVAAALGLPDRDPNSTGTTILIVDPQFDADSVSEIACELVETVLWNFWPRMTLSTPDDRRLRVEIEVNGEHVPIPQPEEFPPLDLFASALESIRSADGDVVKISCGRPAAELGSLAIRKGVTARRGGPATRSSSPFNQPSARIALMRPVELVVRYIEGVPFPDTRFEWAGVFRCSDVDHIEQAFARAEPPAHEDWVPENLPKGPEKTWVKVALRELDTRARFYAVPSSPIATSSSKGPSLAQTASRLGGFLGNVSSRGPGRELSRRPQTGVRKQMSVSSPTVLRLEEDEGSIYAIFGAEMIHRHEESGITIYAEPFVVADGGSAGQGDIPEHLAPEIAWIRHVESGRRVASDHYLIDFQHGNFEFAVRMSGEAAVGLRIRLEEEAA